MYLAHLGVDGRQPLLSQLVLLSQRVQLGLVPLKFGGHGCRLGALGGNGVGACLARRGEQRGSDHCDDRSRDDNGTAMWPPPQGPCRREKLDVSHNGLIA